MDQFNTSFKNKSKHMYPKKTSNRRSLATDKSFGFQFTKFL